MSRVRFGGIVALDKRLVHDRRASIARPDRPERRRQDHAVQLLLAASTRRSSGDIVFEGRSILDRPPHRIADIGIGRTFQNLALFRTMSVLDNVRVGSHPLGRTDFLSNALKLPWTRREEQTLADIAWELIEFLDLADVGAPARRGPAVRHPEARRACARACGAPDAPAARRAGRRPQSHRDQRARRADQAHPRRAAHHHPAGRASHEHGDVDLRQGGGARLRQEDRRGHARAGAERRGRDPRLSRDHEEMSNAARSARALRLLRLDAGAVRARARRRGRAASPRCSARTAPARPRRCARSPAWCRTNGEIRFDGKPIGGRATEDIVRLGIAHVPQGRGTFSRQTVEENLQIGAMTRRGRAGDRGRRRARLRLFPAPEGAPHASRPARSRAASSRCWRSAAP